MEVSPGLGLNELDERPYVLVVDDEDDVRSAVEEILQSEGYPTVGACNGAEALELLRMNIGMPRLILLDLMMPVMDGWAFSEEIGKNPELAGIPILVVTAFSNRTKAFPRAQGIIKKPVDVELLIQLVKQYC